MIDAGHRRALVMQLEEDPHAQRLVTVAVDLVEVYRRAHGLAQAHTVRVLCRSLDILHVAATLELGSTRLVSGDGRQLALARAVGLQPVDVRTGTRAAARPRPG
jgi:hypothetical protein